MTKPLAAPLSQPICRTCKLAISKRRGYEDRPDDLAIWIHLNGKESCDGYGIFASAKPDLNPPEVAAPLPEPICEGDVMCAHNRCWDASRARVRENINKSRQEYLAARNLPPLPEIASDEQKVRESHPGWEIRCSGPFTFDARYRIETYPDPDSNHWFVMGQGDTPAIAWTQAAKDHPANPTPSPVPLGEPAQTLPKRPERLKPMITGKRVQTVQYGIKAASEYTDGMEAYADALEARLRSQERPTIHIGGVNSWSHCPKCGQRIISGTFECGHDKEAM